MYYSRPIQSLLWDSGLHLAKSHLTALLRAGVRSHLIHFSISGRMITYMSDGDISSHTCTLLLGGKVASRAHVSEPRDGGGAHRLGSKVDTYLLPVLLQRRHGGEVAGVVHDLKFLKDTVVR